MGLSEPAESRDARRLTLGGTTFVAFGGCDYLGLSHHPDVTLAIADGLHRFGTSASSSRTTAGNMTPHETLEQEIASFTGVEDATLTPEGMLANIAACQMLASEGRAALLDERAHKSLYAAAQAAQMPILTYRWRDAESAARAAREAGTPVALLTDSVFCADGALAPIPALRKALPDDAAILLDECHALGTLGPAGRGSIARFDINDSRVLLTSTLAKGVGCYGGFVAGTRERIDAVRSSSTAFVCTTPVPPAIACGALSSMRVLNNDASLLLKLRRNIGRVTEGLDRLGVLLPSDSPETPIFAFVPAGGDEHAMRAIDRELRDHRVFIPLIEYPSGPAPLYFRLSVTASHTDQDIDLAIEALGAALQTTKQQEVVVIPPSREVSSRDAGAA